MTTALGLVAVRRGCCISVSSICQRRVLSQQSFLQWPRAACILQSNSTIFLGSSARRNFSDTSKDDKPNVTVDFELGNTDPEDGDENMNKKNASKQKEDIDLSEFTQEIEIRMPDMGEGEGKVVKWYKKEGDIIHYQDTLCDIETPDFTFGMITEDEKDAIMSKILVPEGTEPVEDGGVICITLHKEETKDGKKEK